MTTDWFDELSHEANVYERMRRNKEKMEAMGEIPRSTSPHPDSLVLIIQRQTCACGEVYELPNPTLLFDYGKVRSPVDHWMREYNSLPRRIDHVETNIPACPECFSSCWLEEGGLLKGKK